MAKPGSMPVVKHEAPPSAHASSMGVSQFDGVWVMCGHTHGVIAVEHTSMPARRNAVITRMFSSAYCAVGP